MQIELLRKQYFPEKAERCKGRHTTAEESAAPHRSTHIARQLVLKRALDTVGALALLVFCAPLLAIIAVAVGIGGWPVFYASERLGRSGRPFRCLKFRTMVPGSEQVLAELLRTDQRASAEWARTCKLERDPRVTQVGRVLRATSLDELPQLFNVLVGDMSLVGPRPVPAGELRERYREYAEHYLRVRPGLTGPWQVSGRSDMPYEARVALDVEYVRFPSIRNDLRILARTVPAVLLRRGAR